MSEFTKGPWHVVKQFWPEQGERFVVFHDQGHRHSSRVPDHLVAACHVMDSAQANAHLIAAAPDIYEALKDLCDAIPDETVAADPPLGAWVDQARAALAKASGHE